MYEPDAVVKKMKNAEPQWILRGTQRRKKMCKKQARG
jgi:hypothetical protein